MNKDRLTNKKPSGGGNKKKGIPPTATAYQGLLGVSTVSRTRAYMGVPLPLTLTLTALFVPGRRNNIFEDLAHHVAIVRSGSGIGKPHPTHYGTLSGSGVQQWHNPSGKDSSLIGIVGFDSLSGEHPAPYYASFSDTGDSDPHALHVTPNAAIVTQAYFSQKGRYLKSRAIEDITGKSSVYKAVESITVTWIAGNGSNGGDSPDVYAFNGSSPNSTGLQHDGPLGDYRSPEYLYVQVFNKDNQPIGNRVFLWKPKRDPTPAELATATATGGNPWTNIPLNVYQSDAFTTTVLSESDFGVPIGSEDFFVIRQTGHTAFLDNYGVKRVEVKLSR